MSNYVRLVTYRRKFDPVFQTSLYGAGDRLGEIHTIKGLQIQNNEVLTLLNIQVIDRIKANIPLAFYFFDREPLSISADNSPFDVSDADIAHCTGVASISESDYASTLSNSFGQGCFNTPIKPVVNEDDELDLWVGIKALKDTKVMTANALSFIYYFALDFT
jgi:hypothetical protein